MARRPITGCDGVRTVNPARCFLSVVASASPQGGPQTAFTVEPVLVLLRHALLEAERAHVIPWNSSLIRRSKATRSGSFVSPVTSAMTIPSNHCYVPDPYSKISAEGRSRGIWEIRGDSPSLLPQQFLAVRAVFAPASAEKKARIRSVAEHLSVPHHEGRRNDGCGGIEGRPRRRPPPTINGWSTAHDVPGIAPPRS